MLKTYDDMLGIAEVSDAPKLTDPLIDDPTEQAFLFTRK
jgi:hypothetical protein